MFMISVFLLDALFSFTCQMVNFNDFFAFKFFYVLVISLFYARYNRIIVYFLSFFSSFETDISVAGILNSVAIQKRLMLDFLIDNCTLNLTPTNSQSSSKPSAIPSISSTPSRTTNVYSCLNKCGRSYDSLSSLQHHMRLECTSESQLSTIPIIKQFDCIYCTESFTRRDKLKLHIHDKHHIMIE